MKSFLRILDGVPRAMVIALALALLGFLGWVDFYTGPDFSFLLFYFVPIFLVSWRVGPHASLAMAVLSAAVWLAADVFGRAAYPHPFIPYWNLMMEAGIFIVVSLLLALVKRDLVMEQRLSRHDPLTGVYNRRGFIEQAIREIERARRYGHALTVVYFDVDNFKRLNDERGHAQGDALLARIGETLQAHLRSIDLVARVGGDEFIVLLPEKGPQDGKDVSQKLHQRLTSTVAARWSVTFSMGTITFLIPPMSIDTMLRRADDLMYRVKKDGKDNLLHCTVPA